MMRDIPFAVGKVLLLLFLQAITFPSYSQCDFIAVGPNDHTQASTITVDYTDIAIDGNGTPYIVYRDGSNSNKASVKKYNGSSWVIVGGAGLSAGTVTYTTIAIDGSGTPYVAYQDGGNSNKATVMKYNGSGWVTVGSAGFSAGRVNYPDLAIDGSGTPYVVYQDGGMATVMKFNGSSWVTVGSAGFSGYAYYVSIAIDAGGTPYVVYYGMDSKATVKKYNGSSWVTVGSSGFSNGGVNYTSIAIDGSGTPYVVYQDFGNSSKATVKKYNGSSWVTVGLAGFSTGTAAYTNIAIDSGGTPYVVYRDGGNSSKATVMAYNGSSWVTVGSAGFSAGTVDYTSIAINGSGTPYVVYRSVDAWVKRLGTQLATASTSQSATVNHLVSGLFIKGCNIIAQLTASGANPVSGSVKASVWIESTQPALYVKRHYEITPANNASSATGTVTLFFTQSEFDAFNAVNATRLPASSSDAAGIANLLVEKQGGTSSDGTGLPGTYSSSTTIDPADANIIWNATDSRWEVTIAVTGFSGFFIKTTSIVLPLQWLGVYGSLNARQQARLSWKVEENDVAYYAIEKSSDGRTYAPLATIFSQGNGRHSYQYTEGQSLQGAGYYRIRQVAINDRYSYSPVIALLADNTNTTTVYPTIFSSGFTIVTGKAQRAQLTDIQGRAIITLQLNSGSTYIPAGDLMPGIYIMKTADGHCTRIIKQ